MAAEKASVVIIGTGFAGLGMGIRLKQAGIDDFVILEAADGVGGTWRDNHYPGAACDVQSHLYSFSFEPNPRWSRTFGQQAEILAYLEHCTEKYGLGPHLRFGSEITRASFDERAGSWTLTTRAGRTYEAKAVVAGCGGLSRPGYPSIPGMESFEGKAFHSARWDHATPLDGKTVAVIGTGASAIQIVPQIQPRVKQLKLFQRSPAWVVPKPDRAIGRFEQSLYRRFPFLQRLARASQYARLEPRALAFIQAPWLLALAERGVHRFIELSVPDPALRAKLTPSYRMGCKRILLANDYYPALNQPNVALVTDSITRIAPRGLVTADGVEHAVDSIVYATGFQTGDDLAPFEVRGRGGAELGETWRQGAEAYKGTTVAGFPNFFMIVGPNTGLGHTSMVLMIEAQITYIFDALRTLKEQRLKFVDVRPDAQSRFNGALHARLERTVWATGCNSWYRSKNGRNTAIWPGFTFQFRKLTRRFDAEAYERVALTDAEADAAPRIEATASSAAE